jgi:hypothetical protein
MALSSLRSSGVTGKGSCMVARTRRRDGEAELVHEHLDRSVTEPAGAASAYAVSVSTDTQKGQGDAAAHRAMLPARG